MNRTLKLIFLLSVIATIQTFAQPLYVGSYNIRYQNNDDNKNGNSWTQRCPVVCSQINFEHPDIFGAQEVLHPQLCDMLKHLDGYNYIGVGRDDGKQKGDWDGMPPVSASVLGGCLRRTTTKRGCDSTSSTSTWTT